MMPVLKIQTTMRLKPVTYTKLKKIAIDDNRSVSNLIEHLINQKIKIYEKENGEILLTEEEIYI